MSHTKVEVTVANVTLDNINTYTQHLHDEGFEAYSVALGFGVWGGSFEPNTTFTLVAKSGSFTGDQESLEKFVRNIAFTATQIEREDSVLVTWTEEVVAELAHYDDGLKIKGV